MVLPFYFQKTLRPKIIKEFVEDVKTELGFLAKGRKASVAGESYQLREPSATYKSHSGVENGVIGVENGYFWDINLG